MFNEISAVKNCNCWVVKVLMSHKFFVKVWVFKHWACHKQYLLQARLNFQVNLINCRITEYANNLLMNLKILLHASSLRERFSLHEMAPVLASVWVIRKALSLLVNEEAFCKFDSDILALNIRLISVMRIPPSRSWWNLKDFVYTKSARFDAK